MPDLKMNLQSLCQTAIEAARLAGSIIARHHGRDFRVEHKDTGGSEASQVVTEVDRLAQQAIIQTLEGSLDQYDLALLAEESCDDGTRLEKQAFWCIDPMDGTLAFVRNVPGFSVSIALVSQNGEPLIGVVFDPVTDDCYHAIKGAGAYKNGRLVNLPTLNPELPLTLCTDISFTKHPYLKQTQQGLEDIANKLGLAGVRIDFRIGAVMNAVCVLTTPNTCYFKYARNDNKGGSLWDYAASACLFSEAGAQASDIYGAALDLNRPDSTFMNHRGISFSTLQTIGDEIIALNGRVIDSFGVSLEK